MVVEVFDVSVLALSSRFDGPLLGNFCAHAPGLFQYSLCRVVLMVYYKNNTDDVPTEVSVLALSSRFDGPQPRPHAKSPTCGFSTRSVESF